MSTDTRIESLESQVRTFKRVLYTLCGVGVLGGLLAATNLNTVPDVIQAKKFEVVNDEGKVVLVLEANAYGGLLYVRNKDGIRVAVVGTNQSGSATLGVFSKEGPLVAHIAVNKFGDGAFAVLDKDGKYTAIISTNSDGDGAVATYDSKGNRTSNLPDLRHQPTNQPTNPAVKRGCATRFWTVLQSG